jgi:hypothetical protein
MGGILFYLLILTNKNMNIIKFNSQQIVQIHRDNIPFIIIPEDTLHVCWPHFMLDGRKFCVPLFHPHIIGPYESFVLYPLSLTGNSRYEMITYRDQEYFTLDTCGHNNRRLQLY